MNSIHTDQNLRQALHRIYVAQFSAIQDFPGIFTKNDASRMLTGLMGSRPWSWRVIGITHAALDVFAQNDFKRVRGLIERGHITERSQTAQQLYFGRDDAMPIDEFYEFFLERDKTVLMAKPENKSCTENAPPDYLPVPAELQLFPCGSLIGWKHRTQEIEFLRQLHASQSAQTN